MRQARDVEYERSVAWLAVVVVHLLFWWLLTRPTLVVRPPGEDSDALRVVWIDPPIPAVPPAQLASAMPSPTSSVAAPAHPPTQAAIPQRNDGRTSPADTIRRSMSAVFIVQGQRWAETQAAPDDFARDPLVHRPATLPGKPGERIRMREPVTPAVVARHIGALFGGPGYTTDPCPLIRANIAGMAPGGDRERLQEELRRQHAYCH